MHETDGLPPVFVDSSGRRRRRVRRAGYVFGAVSLVYAGLVGASFSGGPVSPHALLPFPDLPERPDRQPATAPREVSAVPADDAGPAKRRPSPNRVGRSVGTAPAKGRIVVAAPITAAPAPVASPLLEHTPAPAESLPEVEEEAPAEPQPTATTPEAPAESPAPTQAPEEAAAGPANTPESAQAAQAAQAGGRRPSPRPARSAAR